MTVVIDGTNGISGVDGTASSPAIEGTDSNTGIFFPAADTIAFAEGGTEVARFDSSGNFGIGTPSPATALTLGNNRVLSWPNAAGNYNGTTTGTQILKFSDNNLYIDNLDASTNIIFRRTSNTESMRIDSSGNVGIGTSSPGSRLHVNAAAGNSGVISVTASAGNGGFVQLAGNGVTSGTASFDLIHGGDSVGYVYNRSNAALVFGTNNAERARITAGGDFQYNNGYGSVATAYGCRAWVNFDGTGTYSPNPSTSKIRAAGNVTSITKNGTGDFTVNFTNAMPDANYSIAGSSSATSTGATIQNAIFQARPDGASACRLQTTGTSLALADREVVSVSIFR